MQHHRFQLDLAGEYVLANARPEATRVIVWIGIRPLLPKHNIIKAEHVRRAGIRTIVIDEDNPLFGYVDANVAYQLEDYFVAPDRETLRQVHLQLGEEFSARVLARDLVVRDKVPANMEYVQGSAVAAAQWDPATRVLTWRASEVSFAGWRAGYEVKPQEEGYWSTNAWAELEFIDGIGHPGKASFPIPWVRVLAPPPTATPTLVPTQTPEPTPTRRPERLFLPLALVEFCHPESQTADVALVIDASSSMEQPAGSSGAISKLRAPDMLWGSSVMFDALNRVVQPERGTRE